MIAAVFSRAHAAVLVLAGKRSLLSGEPASDPHPAWRSDVAQVRARRARGDKSGEGQAIRRARASCNACLQDEIAANPLPPLPRRGVTA